MSWGSHPNTITMAQASNIAKDKAGETNSLKYLKAYREAYELLAGGECGTDRYFRDIDLKIESMEKGDKKTIFLIIPLMA